MNSSLGCRWGRVILFLFIGLLLIFLQWNAFALEAVSDAGDGNYEKPRFNAASYAVLAEKTAVNSFTGATGYVKDEPQNLPIINIGKDKPDEDNGEPAAALGGSVSGRSVPVALGKTPAANKDTPRAAGHLPKGEMKPAMAGEALAVIAVPNYTDILVPSTTNMVFDGREEFSEHGTWAKTYRFWGNAGQTMQIRMDSDEFDSLLFLYNANLNRIAFDDDGGGNYNARIVYTLTSSGYYYIVATQYASSLGFATLNLSVQDSSIFYDTNGSYGGPWQDWFAANLPFDLTYAIPWAPAGNYLFRGWTAQRVSVADGASYSGRVYQPGETVTLTGSTTLYALWAYCDSFGPPQLSIEGDLTDNPFWSAYTWGRSFCYSFSLSSGQVLLAAMDSAVIDPVLVLLNEAGDVVAFDDDSGGGLNALLSYYAQTSGIYYLYATTWNTPAIGGAAFSLSVTAEIAVTLAYDVNGGYGAPDSVNCASGQTVTVSEYFPYRPGYIFMGWSLSPTATWAQYLPFDSFTLYGSVTLFAVWRSYTPVTLPFETTGSISAVDGLSQRGTRMNGYSFYAPAGSVIVATMDSSEVDSYLFLLDSNGYEVARNDDYDTGYGWTLNSKLIYVVDTPGTYYLQATTYGWETGNYNLRVSFEKTGIITYDAQGGSPTPLPQEIKYGEPALISSILPVRLGNTFLGWNTDPSGNGMFYQRSWQYNAYGDLHLYAIWRKYNYLPTVISAQFAGMGQITPNDPLLEADRGTRCDNYRVWLTAGQEGTIQMESHAMDSYLYLLDPDGRYLTDDDDGGGNLDALITFSAPADGWYYIIATQNGEGYGDYLLSLSTLSTGFTVSGLVKSYYPTKPAKLQLFNGMDTEAAYEVFSTCDDSGSGQKEQNFTFPNVEPGAYTLVITKDAHTSFTVSNIKVKDKNIDLRNDSRPEVQLMTLRCGDINGDGNINNSDLTVLWRQANYNRSARNADEPKCDLNGDGLINNIDLTILWLAYNYNRGAIEITAKHLLNPLTNLPLDDEEAKQRRLILVCIDNYKTARPQAGISAAELMYEVSAEGGISRLMALFFADTLKLIGPVRSARPYMVDVAREWQALFVHCGGSPDALNYLDTGTVNWIDEMSYSQYFWRDKTRDMPHNLFTSSANLYSFLQDKGWEQAVTPRALSFFAEDEGPPAEASLADTVYIDFPANKNTYIYDPQSWLYARSIDDEPHIDLFTGEQIQASNLLVQRIKSTVLDDEGRLALTLVGEGEAQLFTRGTVQEGTWKRASLTEPTRFYGADGAEWQLASGQTWIHLCDDITEVSYENSAVKQEQPAGF
jgi:hypothetical protein